MYIEKYWGNYIGGTDDSLTLLDYLIDKQKPEITLSEIFAECDGHIESILIGY
ncbi:MAG: imm68 putative immunity domain-containing protein [Faecalimonas sp.]|nr:imm68 putative immunity domain-containing protein [Faecalimonas sp.]